MMFLSFCWDLSSKSGLGAAGYNPLKSQLFMVCIPTLISYPKYVWCQKTHQPSVIQTQRHYLFQWNSNSPRWKWFIVQIRIPQSLVIQIRDASHGLNWDESPFHPPIGPRWPWIVTISFGSFSLSLSLWPNNIGLCSWIIIIHSPYQIYNFQRNPSSYCWLLNLSFNPIESLINPMKNHHSIPIKFLENHTKSQNPHKIL